MKASKAVDTGRRGRGAVRSAAGRPGGRPGWPSRMRRGKPMARLVPAGPGDRAGVADAIRELRGLDDGLRLGGLDWKELRDEGRR